MVFHRLKESKLGLSTIIGGVIIMAIIFTVITPLLFYANTVNNLYDNIATEMRDLDQQRTWETMEVLAWVEEGERYLYFTNQGSIAVDIARVWVVPESPHPPQHVSFSDLTITPGDTVELNDPTVNAHIDDLGDTRYFLKIVTARGNIFTSNFVTERFEPGYGHPLVILASSHVEVQGNKYIITLEIANQMGYDFFVDYVVLTAFSEGGTKSQVKVMPETGVYGWHFLPGSPEEPVVYIHTIEATFSPPPDFIKCELVSPGNFVIGAFYFIGPWT